MTGTNCGRALSHQPMRAALFIVLLGCSAHTPSPPNETAVTLPAHQEALPKSEVRDDKGHTASEWIALGDEAFAQTRLVDAVRFYQTALQAGDSELSGYAYYKLGFIRWNQNDGPEALDAFMHAIRLGNTKISSQATRDIIPVYAQYGRPDTAYYFFRNVTPDPVASLVRLEREYEDEDKPDAAKKIRAQIASHP
jgi:tetratricopeptide (TPR) repeat protein